MDCFLQTLVQVRIWPGFVRRTKTKMNDKMAAAYQFRCCGRSNLVIFIEFLSNFINGLLPSDSGSSSNMGFADGR